MTRYFSPAYAGSPVRKAVGLRTLNENLGLFDRACYHGHLGGSYMPKPLEVKLLQNFRLWLRYEDGTTGEVDLSPP